MHAQAEERIKLILDDRFIDGISTYTSKDIESMVSGEGLSNGSTRTRVTFKNGTVAVFDTEYEVENGEVIGGSVNLESLT